MIDNGQEYDTVTRVVRAAQEALSATRIGTAVDVGALERAVLEAPPEPRAPPAERARTLHAALPDVVRIGPHDFSLRKCMALGDRESRFGSTNFLTHEVTIVEHASPTNLVDTLLHEALHAVLRNAAVHVDPVLEEQVVGAVAPGLVGLFRDNPWLAGWIAGAVR